MILDRIIGSCDPEVHRRSSKRSVFHEGNGPLFLGFDFLQTDIFLEAGILDDSTNSD